MLDNKVNSQVEAKHSDNTPGYIPVGLLINYLSPLDSLNAFFFLQITGHVGAPIPCNKIKLVDVEEMEYYARDNKGEVSIISRMFLTSLSI